MKQHYDTCFNKLQKGQFFTIRYGTSYPAINRIFLVVDIDKKDTHLLQVIELTSQDNLECMDLGKDNVHYILEPSEYKYNPDDCLNLLHTP